MEGDRELGNSRLNQRGLFPLLNHADAMSFVVVLSFLPALYAVANLADRTGRLAEMAGLKCLATVDPSELFDPHPRSSAIRHWNRASRFDSNLHS